MSPDQGFAAGVLCCILGWALVRIAAATIEHGRTERAAADLDIEHPRTSDEDWDRHVTSALKVAEPPVDDTVLVPLYRIPPQPDGADR